MTSEILEAFKPFVGRKTTRSDTYRAIRERLEYFEDFVKGEGVPDFVGMINQFVSTNIANLQNPKPSVNYFERDRQYLVLKGQENGLVVSIGLSGRIALKIELQPSNLSGPEVHINPFGHNRNDWQNLTKKGVKINAYKMPRDIAGIVLKDFEKVKGENRNDILLKLAASEEITECYPKDYWVSFHKKQIEEDGTTQRGIDEESVWTLEKPGKIISVFGNANGHNMGDPRLNLIARVEREGVKFEFPKIN